MLNCNMCFQEYPFLINVWTYMKAEDGEIQYVKRSCCYPCIVATSVDWLEKNKEGDTWP